MSKTVGLVMIVKNEEQHLEKCLSCAQKLVDKIYITDTGSTDKTIEIANHFGAHVTHFGWVNDFAAARNFSLDQSDCDWNLVLDADEHLLSGDREDILKFIENGNRNGAIQIRNFCKSPDGELAVDLSLATRLFPKGTRYTGKIHEQIDSDLPSVKLPLVFEHDGYLIEGKGERNLAILLTQVKEDPGNPYTLFQTAHTLRLLNEFDRADPYYQEFYRLIPESAGYRRSGVLSYLKNLMAQNAYERALELIQNERHRMTDCADYHFLCGNFFTKLVLSDIQRYISFLPEIESSYRHCLEIGERALYDGQVGCGSFLAAYNLGVWYEVNGKIHEARALYQQSAADGYALAAERLKILESMH